MYTRCTFNNNLCVCKLQTIFFLYLSILQLYERACEYMYWSPLSSPYSRFEYIFVCMKLNVIVLISVLLDCPWSKSLCQTVAFSSCFTFHDWKVNKLETWNLNLNSSLKPRPTAVTMYRVLNLVTRGECNKSSVNINCVPLQSPCSGDNRFKCASGDSP